MGLTNIHYNADQHAFEPGDVEKAEMDNLPECKQALLLPLNMRNQPHFPPYIQDKDQYE